MDRYSYNIQLSGFDSIEMDYNKIRNIEGSEIVIMLTGEESESYNLYKCTKKLASRNRVLLITTLDDTVFRNIAAMLVLYNCYDIYKVSDISVVSVDYVEAALEREPSFFEVQEFIGGGITAVGEITTMLYSIENIVDSGDMDRLKEYVEDNLGSIEKMSATIDYMRKNMDVDASREVISRVEELSYQLSEKTRELEEAIADKEELEKSKSETSEDSKKNKEELSRLRDTVKQLEKQLENSNGAISYYHEVDLGGIKHNIQRVLYFKEISYAQYTNSFVNNLESMLRAYKLKVKTVIYDSNTEMYEKYGATVVGARDYANLKQGLFSCSKNVPIVLSEPNMYITNDMLKYEEGYDVLIIYDRMQKYANIVKGNNVTNIYVVNSSKDLEGTSKRIRYTTSDVVLTRNKSSIVGSDILPDKNRVITISTITNYNTASDSAKISKYSKLPNVVGGKSVIDYIIELANIEPLLNR